MSTKQRIKRAILPAAGPRTLPFGVSRGLRMQIDFQRQTGQYLGLYEIEVARHLRRLCRGGRVSFDVGAREGYDALICAKLTGAPVLSFEAEPANLPLMQETFALNPTLAALVTPVLGYVGDGGGDTLRLDDFVDEARPPGFVKVDVEGAEESVLRGAERLLAGHRPALIVETHSWDAEAACGRLLASYGYRLTIVNQRRVLPDHRPTGHNRWLIAE